MIRKIGVIYQDRNSFGFLLGIRDRLECEAELVAPPGPVGVQRRLTRKNAKKAWAFFKKQGVDLVVRFTDADGGRWQEIARKEREVFPDEADSVLVCGVAVNNPEEWLYLDADYLAKTLGLSSEELRNPIHRTDRIKRALTRLACGQEGQSGLVARLVRQTPEEVFRRWLQSDDALREFYSDCRKAAIRENCETANELDASIGQA
ncbi:MAG: hypothetical protein KAV82_11845 [Phycisphaerae bacterium]|nr:hypothetical protein [Phycisphaerae bacterium]